ncbi:hypothetical protein ACHAW5_007541 [Stephanodiscus triporus]|uniref:BZIP domain-containing protein n=1 Tax=Stephanodiscus triporus TaxID=2934178 RepID=A0ABD3QBP2_9STRA
MAGKRARQPAAAAPPKSSMEESADALAGVEGALTGSKRKGTPSPKKKGGETTTATATADNETAKRPRSNSMEQLVDVAGSILKEEDLHDQEDKKGGAWYATNDVAIAAAAAAAASVPDPMADAADEIPASTSAVAATAAAVAAAAVPTGFRKKAATKKATAAKSPTPDDGNKSRKTQITYNPDITMTKEQLTAWRREMRRVRNRESAAASRRKVRDRIDELEDEVEIWKRRYQEVMARLGQSEGEKEEEEREVRREVDLETAAVGEGNGHSQV